MRNARKHFAGKSSDGNWFANREVSGLPEVGRIPSQTMIRHILLFRFNEGVPSEVREGAIERLQKLGELCPTIGKWSIGINFADSPSAHDVVEIGDFESQEDLDAYKAHPAHREFSDFIRPLATWALADYKTEEE